MKSSFAGLLQTLGIIIYCTLMGLFFQYAGDNFEETSAIFASIFMLFLLVISAGVTGSMVFGYPAYLALKKEFKKAIHVLLFTLLYSAIAIGALFAILLLSQ